MAGFRKDHDTGERVYHDDKPPEALAETRPRGWADEFVERAHNMPVPSAMRRPTRPRPTRGARRRV